MVELSILTGLPYRELEDLPGDILETYWAVLKEHQKLKGGTQNGG